MTPDNQPLASRVFDQSMLVVAATLTLAAGLDTIGNGGFEAPAQMWLCVPVIVLISRYPVLLDRSGGAVEIGFDSCVVAFLGAVAIPAHEGALIWAAGAVAAQLLVRRRLVARLFNIGVQTTSGIVALWVIDWLGRGHDVVSIEQLLAVLAGCTAYFVLDFVISEVSVALEHSVPFTARIGQTEVLVAMASIVGVDSLGYLAALVAEMQPWAIILLGVPVGTLLVASRATARDRERSRRMRVLFDVSRSVQSQTSADGVLDLLSEGARELVRAPGCGLREVPPGQGEVGARVTDDSRDWWLVASEWQRGRSAVAWDREHLDQLALAGSEALFRLKLTREMTFLARHDALTELANRSVFLDRVEHALEVARRRGSMVAVLFCDLDGFKRINDRFGHSAGDAVLVTTAQRIAGCVRASDTVARLGGDEFAILLEDVHDPVDLDRATSLLLHAVAERIEVSGHQVDVSTSIGFATSDSATSGEAILRSADIAMYEAKSQGKNCVARYHPELGSARVRELELVEALRAAIAQDDLSVVYQPVFSVRTGAIVGLEALARWRRDGYDVSPNQFVPIAEESGQVVALGERILERVTRDARDIRRLGVAPISVAVNISAQQLRSPSFVDKIRETRAGLGSFELVLEVTERDVVHEDLLSQEVMARLVEEGVRFAVDDFGVGFSSIGYLQSLPVHILKTDRSFVADIEKSERSANLLRSMLLMGRALGLDVVVEGVERQSQLDALRGMGNEVFAQGYHLARPLSLVDVLALLHDSHRARTAVVTG